MERHSIKLNTILNTFRMALTVLMPLITFPYVSRIFLTEGMGQLNFANSVVAIFTLFASLGIYTYGVREGSKVREDKLKFSKLAHELLVINGASTVVTYVVFFACVFFLPAFQSYRGLLLIYSITILFTALGLDWVYGTYEEYTYITIRQIATQIFCIASMFLLVHKPSDIYIWAGISVVSGVGANAFSMIRARRYISFKKCAEYNIKRHLIPILVLFATQLASKVYNNLDTVLLGIMATDHNTGLYSAAVKVNTILITVFSAMTPVFVPRIMSMLHANKIGEYQMFLKKIFRLVLSLEIPAVVGLEMLRKPIITLLAGEAFIDASTTMMILIPVILITSCANVLYYDIIVPQHKEKNVLICTVTAALLNLILSVCLIPSLKENGAAIGSLVAELAGLGLAVFFAGKTKLLTKAVFPSVISYCMGGIGIAVSCLICGRYLSDNIVLHLSASILSSVVVYGLVLLAFHDPIATEGVNLVKKLLQRSKRT